MGLTRRRRHKVAVAHASVGPVRRQGTVRMLRSRLRRFEALYELDSRELEKAIEKGTIRETAHVARWMVTWRAYRRLAEEATGPARS